MKRIVIACMVVMLLSGCGVKPLEVFTTPVERQPLDLKDPPPVKLSNVEWIVINKENYKAVFDDLEKNKKDVVLFALTDDGYEQLALNFAQIRNYIIRQRNILMKYREYYEPVK